MPYLSRVQFSKPHTLQEVGNFASDLS